MSERIDPTGVVLPLEETRFTECLIRENGLQERDFGEWAFYPGMLFAALTKWWGDRGMRDAPHEGLDLCLYRDRRQVIHRLGQGTRIPAMYDGIVVRMLDDFLGRSVVMAHRFPGDNRVRFYTMYGHTIPCSGLRVGQVVRKGQIVARLSDATKSRTNALPHLHISLGWTPNAISYDQLDWGSIPHVLTLLDPLQLIAWPYRTVEPT
jgi:murein DD-endopeptidase MepM/ murein hydrolase activator NlpD